MERNPVSRNYSVDENPLTGEAHRQRQRLRRIKALILGLYDLPWQLQISSVCGSIGPLQRHEDRQVGPFHRDGRASVTLVCTLCVPTSTARTSAITSLQVKLRKSYAGVTTEPCYYYEKMHCMVLS